MSSIGSIGSSTAYSYSSSVQRQRPDPTQIANDVFSKLDTNNQGYLSEADLQSAFSKLSSSSDSTSSSATTASNSSVASGTNSSNATTEISDLFKKLDSDSDGKVTKQEFSTGLQKLSDELESQFNARRTSGAGTGSVSSQSPPPPPSSQASDTDQTQSAGSGGQSAGGASAVSGSSSTKTYDPADTNEDGTVSTKESLAYAEKLLAAAEARINATANSATSGTSSSSTSGVTGIGSTSASSSSASTSINSDNSGNANTSSDAALFRKALQLLQAYSDPFQSGGTTSSISVSA